LGPVYAVWRERKRPGAYEEIYAQRRRPEYREQHGAIANVLAAGEYVDYWIGENTWNFVGREHDRPWFAWCGFCGPHPPYDPPEPYASMYDPDAIPVPPLLRARQQNVIRPQRANPFDREGGEFAIRRLIAYYWGMMTFIDDMVGRVVDALTRRGLWENTLVIFTTDHGAMTGDFGQTGKGNFLEQVIRVPYIVVPPGSAASSAPTVSPRTCGDLVEHVDLVPTILDYAGIAQPAELPGRSLRPALEGDPSRLAPKELVICEYGAGTPVEHAQCVRTERFKYIYSEATQRAEFYDLEADPQELTNVAEEPQYAAEIRRHAELFILHRLRTETTPWKGSVFARTPQPLDPFGLPPSPGSADT
jgi:arylsulfatase A-like enzyme